MSFFCPWDRVNMGQTRDEVLKGVVYVLDPGCVRRQ